MYIDIDIDPRRRTIIPFPGRREPHEEREPWVKPFKPYPRPIIPSKPFIPVVPIPTDDEYPVSKDEVIEADTARTEAEKNSVLKKARGILNRDLRTGRRSFPISLLCDSPSYVDFMVSQIINEYTAAGWTIKRSTKSRPSDPTDGWDNLEFS